MDTNQSPDRAPTEPVGPAQAQGIAVDTSTKATLTAGRDVWTVPGIAELGIPDLKMTDGPNGARGDQFVSGGARSIAVPCGAALAATFDPDLVRSVGELLGREALQKNCRVLLAPTINLVRSPLYGRSFECYGEDPWLSGLLAAAFVEGVQSQGVATTPKHFVGNETEHQRYTIDSVIDERTLREVYLQPFEWAVRHGNALGIMTAYNRLNGTYCTEHVELLTGILRTEWGFEGFVVSDWFGAGDTVASLEAGLDVQMPGPDRFFGAPVAQAIANGETSESHLDTIIDRRLHLHTKLDAWHHDGDEPEQGIEHQADRELARRAAASAMTLLTNDGVLPLDLDSVTVALIGPNAQVGHIMGGGSASLAAHRRPSPAQVLRERIGDRLRVEPGCVIDKSAPSLRPTDGLDVTFFAWGDAGGQAVGHAELKNGKAIWAGEPSLGMGTVSFTAVATASVTAEISGTHEFTLIQTGPGRMSLNGEQVIDGVTTPPAQGEALFGAGSVEMSTTIELQAGEVVEVEVEISVEDGTGVRGALIGHRPPTPTDLVERAVTAAAESDVAIVVVGTNNEWETEGSDRQSIDLPGDQDALVSAVCRANERTVVVVNAGAPVTMAWADEPAAILMAWLGGQEMSPALVDVVGGDADPGGRLPVTIPLRIEHTPAFGSFPGESNRTEYREGLLVGHRWYDTRKLPVRFPFGHGHSYTSFDWGVPQIAIDGAASATVQVAITNVGDRPGSEVVQLYLSPPPSPYVRPDHQLIGVAKVHLDPGETSVATIDVRPRSLAYWNPANTEHIDIANSRDGAAAMERAGTEPPVSEPGWYIDSGLHRLRIARSIGDIVAEVGFEVTELVGPLDGEDTLP